MHHLYRGQSSVGAHGVISVIVFFIAGHYLVLQQQPATKSSTFPAIEATE